MNRVIREYGWLLALAGALLAGACAFLIALVFDLPPLLNGLLTLVGGVGGAWYGMRLTRVMARRETVETGPPHHPRHRG